MRPDAPDVVSIIESIATAKHDFFAIDDAFSSEFERKNINARSRDELIRLFLIHQQCEMSLISRPSDIVNILIKASEGYLISNN